MPEKQRSEIGAQKRSLKLSPALGDWTTYKPNRILVKRVKSGLYGFDRLSKEDLEAAHLEHYGFAEKFCEAIRNDLGISSEIHSVEALQSTYSNFLTSVFDPLVEGKVVIPNAKENALFSIDLPLAGSIINSVLGLNDTGLNQRELTEAEYKILNTGLKDYASLCPFGASEIEFFSSMHLTPAPSTPPSSSFAYFVIEIKINEAYGKIVFGYPGKLLKQLVKKLKSEAPTLLRPERLPAGVAGQSYEPLTAKLGTTEISSSDINSLEIGDVLSLDRSIFSALPVYLGEKEVFMVQPGVKNGKIALKVISVEKDRFRVSAPPPVIEEKVEEKIEEEAIEEKPEEPFEEPLENDEDILGEEGLEEGLEKEPEENREEELEDDNDLNDENEENEETNEPGFDDDFTEETGEEEDKL
ncbi:hypothetical protein A2276_02940 [candidate division WOR-1 bacterium RIFOXYA12_FULL_43_27]|uniref:Flagellar motor switch protein FliM n=1 Tax=candidate division WOR-1 bacterium RIFOXYC2_FULL_46_14 TaxID=1802587 RepID=A0A1F4U7K0_UNCSA|nr:MAG: hypothetical protein A2276_02940 [candidate division WOR-1 bacterium RIFOXYA12_FULL_43_27]OGC19338.1 MAG: hypothetical protein A2292_01395 [candidate division WOR-1 bacterium RIFOXYB2_FULL_46_45]OGC30327.1 MAG: hypothetical protein A2232_01395 [candidate division WOR-1 bacterium RIFOXYA2_FULL_46_56]OGC40928.1 MAG: hypothetical protein A2438_01395 [candidate division WOR-1 bacterium RIFOXYC2_FULL_46_14]